MLLLVARMRPRVRTRMEMDMIDRIKRRGFLKVALGGAAAVALGEISRGDGRAARRRISCADIQLNYGFYCDAENGGPCGGMCHSICDYGEPYLSCPLCTTIRTGTCPAPTPEPEPNLCSYFDLQCSEEFGGVCGFNCTYACYADSEQTCAVCTQNRAC